MHNSCRLSVLMVTYNNCAYISEAINSILNQTFTDFEFIIVDDGSTDDTRNILQACDDPRIRVITHDKNSGRPAARNTALYAASGEYCAWMDSDDICPPFRLAKQIAFMDAQFDVLVSGGHYQSYETKMVRKIPLTDDAIRVFMLWNSPFPVPTVILRRLPCLRVGGFSPDFPVGEDRDFWRRLALLPDWRFANLDEILMQWREHPHADRRAYSALQFDRGAACVKTYLLDLGMAEGDLDMEAHLALCFQNEARPVSLSRARAWAERLMRFNLEAKLFDPELFNDSCLRQLHSACVKARWLPAGLKRLIPAQVKYWVKKNVFALKQGKA